MGSIFWAWAISAIVLVAMAAGLGTLVRPPGVLGILVDSRGRFSLTHFQLVVWTLVVLSLISGVFFGRLVDGVDDPLGFSIPDEVLGLMGITVGSTVAATAIKSSKDVTAADRVAASGTVAELTDRPRFGQIFLQEEGAYADRVIDIGKYQNFVFTLVLVVAYAASAIGVIDDAETAADVTALPGLSATFLTLLGISHAGYALAKVPNRPGEPGGLTAAIVATGEVPPGLSARNPG